MAECELCDGAHAFDDCPQVSEMVGDLTEEVDATQRLECHALPIHRFTVGRGFNRQTGTLMANLILFEEDGEEIATAFALEQDAVDKLTRQLLTVSKMLWQTVYVYSEDGDDD